jgi:hypothetical protein
MREVTRPQFYTIRQPFERPVERDISAAVVREMKILFPNPEVLSGKTVAVTAGSRGIANIDMVTKCAVDFLIEHGAEPFIVPAMGSHGGGTPEGQTALLDHYGISEGTMGVPVKASMDTYSPGIVEGVEIHCAQVAWDADIILPLNRIKAHTGIKGPLESGISKILAIGLGKLKGAECYHSPEANIPIAQAIRTGAQWLIDQDKIPGGLSLVENAFHETAIVGAVPRATFFETEEALLLRSKELLPRLPIPKIDLLWIKEIGKDISGNGFDTNVINRHPHAHMPGMKWLPEGPQVIYMMCSQLTEDTEGNALGLGLFDFSTEICAAQVDHYKTQLNALTAFAPNAASLPLLRKNDLDMLEAAMSVLRPRPEGPRIVGIKNTLDCAEAFVTEAVLPMAEEYCNAEVLEGPYDLQFDSSGQLEWFNSVPV